MNVKSYALVALMAFGALGVNTPAAYGQRTPVEVPTVKNEADAVKWLATSRKGKAEVVLWDMTRVDLLTADHAIEVDWAGKWAEAIGQSLYYSELTGRKPGIILLTEDPKADARFIFRCQTVTAKHGIKLWVQRVRKIK